MRERVQFANQLRGIAALAVVVTHYLGVFWFCPETVAGLILSGPSEPAQIPWLASKLTNIPYFSWGPFGVSLFFLISGFVIPFSLNQSSTLSFSIRRILRIYPLYMLGFAVTVALIYWNGKLNTIEFPYTIKQLSIHLIPGIRDLFSVPVIDGIVWTLEIEVKFYVLCVLFRKCLFDIRLITLPFILLLAQIALKFLLEPSISPICFLHEARLVTFMLIGTSYYLVHQRKISLEQWTLCLVVIAALNILEAVFFDGTGASFLPSQGWALLCFFLAGSFPRLVNNSLFSFLARISYPLYLIHGLPGYILMQHLQRWHVPPILMIGITLSVALALAYSLHRLVEVPLLTFSKNLLQRKKVPSETFS